MNIGEGFAQHVKNEERVHEEIATRHEEEACRSAECLQKKLEKKEKEIDRLKESAAFHLRERDILARHPDTLRMQSYGEYLNGVVHRMNGCHVKGTRIVQDGTNQEDVGHRIERELFGRPRIGARQNVITPKRVDIEAKEEVFDDLVAYYGHDFFQRRIERAKKVDGKEGCQLEQFMQSTLIKGLNNMGARNPEIKIVSAVGTPLDFHFGVDAWIEIVDDNYPAPERVFIDLKTDAKNLEMEEGSFANMKVTVDTCHGEVDLTSEKNVKLLIAAAGHILYIYKQKRSSSDRI